MVDKPTEAEEYELLPHREIEELKDELQKLKEFEIAPSKKLHVSLLELNQKLDKLITIFEDAKHELRVEEGGLSFTEKIRPVLEKMNKVLEQNAEIASGILAVADMVKEMKGEKPESGLEKALPPLPETKVMPPAGMPPGAPPGMPPPPPPATPPAKPAEPLPPLPKKRTFGI